jgi:hypothetical protein
MLVRLATVSSCRGSGEMRHLPVSGLPPTVTGEPGRMP